MDSVYDKLKLRFKDRVNFVRFNFEDHSAEELIDDYEINEPPASIVIDAKGRVVMKSEGVRSIDDIAGALEVVLDPKGESCSTDGGKR